MGWALLCLSRKANNVELGDLTGGPTKTVDLWRFKLLIAPPGTNVQAMTVAALGEVKLNCVIAHRGLVRKRTLEFHVQ